MNECDFKDILQRVFEAAGCRTQVELADFLGIRQSSISDAKRRESIPAEWIIKLIEKKHINPDWLLRGEQQKYLMPSDTLQKTKTEVWFETQLKPLDNLSSQDLINELVKRALT